MSSRLAPVPITIREANAFVEQFHRHSRTVQGARFAIGASDGEQLHGVAIVGRPVARRLDDGFTAEVLRCCVLPAALKNAPSYLYGRCWRIWQQMGGKRMVTYTLATESGASLRAAGWKIIGEVAGAKDGNGWTSRPGRDWQPIYGQQKFRWEPEPCE